MIQEFPNPRRAAMTDVTGVLRQTRLLREAPADDLAELVSAARRRAFRRGQVVFSRDDPGEGLVVVISGRVKVMMRSADGGELTLTVVGPGGTLGELSIADGGPRSADAETLEPCELLFIPADAVRRACQRSPEVARALTDSIAASLRRLSEAASDLVFLDLPRRVAKVLLAQPRDGDGAIRPGLSQEEIARQSAGTRQSVNAAMRGFQRRGWIDVQDRTVIISQPAALSRFAG
jgi:CRP/FNR family transcriptional regulator, cyclic AMP receptor protein